jgi:hypothetical protein
MCGEAPKIVGAVFDGPRYNAQYTLFVADAVFATIFRWMNWLASAGRPNIYTYAYTLTNRGNRTCHGRRPQVTHTGRGVILGLR